MSAHSGPVARREFLKALPRYLVRGIGKGLRREGEARVPRIDATRCHAWGETGCQLCYLACPRRESAIKMEDQKPVIIASGCDGCAVCEDACRMVNDPPAIRMIFNK